MITSDNTPRLTNEELRERITQRIRKEIKDREWKFKDVADWMGVSHSTITQMLSGKVYPTMYQLYQLANLFEMFVDQFFFDDLDKETQK